VTVLKYITLSLSLCALCFGAGWFVSYKTRPTPPPIVIRQDVDRPVYKTIYVPKNSVEWLAWEQTPIIINRRLDDKNYYHITASDGYKETKVVDKITVGESGNWKMVVGFCAAGVAIGALTVLVIR